MTKQERDEARLRCEAIKHPHWTKAAKRRAIDEFELHAPTDLPAALDEIERLEKEIRAQTAKA